MENRFSRGFTLWLTGLPAAGKSTVGDRLAALLAERGYADVERLDGDEVRKTLCKDLGFSPEDRRRNLERVALLAGALSRHRIGVICSFVSPIARDRDFLRAELPDFLEVHVDAPSAVCEARDPKGMWKKARAGEMKSFTGVSAPYEAPTAPDLVLPTGTETPDTCARRCLELLVARGYAR